MNDTSDYIVDNVHLAWLSERVLRRTQLKWHFEFEQSQLAIQKSEKNPVWLRNVGKHDGFADIPSRNASFK